MFLGMPLPTWNQILTHKKPRGKRSFYEESMNTPMLLAESCMSINLILNAVKEVEKKERVKILVPDYFCNQTLYSFHEDWMDIVFYPIATDMNPNWDYLKMWVKNNEFDALLFTHYFGKYYGSISRAKELCKNQDALLVEDCAHVLYPTGKMGTSGDFVIYSPHKQLPVMDGAVLVCNENNQKPVVTEINQWIKEKYACLPKSSGTGMWFMKKALQKLLPIHRSLTYYSGIHFGDEIGDRHEPKRISDASYNMLCDFEYIDFKKAAYIRRDNLEMMNYILSKKYPDIVPLMDSSIDVPYFAAYSLEKAADKNRVAKDIIKAGFTLLCWPDLPIQLKGIEGHSDSEQLSENVIVLPIHQDLRPQRLVKKFLRE